MKVAYLNKINNPLLISKKINFPSLRNGQVLVKIIYTGICKSQIYEIFGGRDNKKYIPHMLGHEATGIVIDKAKDVKKVKKNDRVILTWLKCSGIQATNPKYFNGKKIINSGSVTTFSSQAIVSENRILKLPKDISFRKGVILGCAFPTGAGMIINNISKFKNKKIAFVGLGGVGVSALLASLNSNLEEIYGFDIDKKKINFLKKNIKSNKIIFSNFTSINKKKFTNYFDFVFETSGSIKGIEDAFKILNYKGKMIFASHPHRGKKIKIDPFELIKGKKIFGSWGGDINYEKKSNEIFKLFRKIENYESIFNEKIYKFENINKAIKDLKANKVLRPIIKL